MATIRLARVSKCFHLRPDRARSFQELIISRFKRQPGPRSPSLFWALRDVSFTVERGETLGLIGSNGTGKSTCLKLLARILEPTSGAIDVHGRVSALLELGAGFHPELTGRENVYLNGSILGLARREMRRRFDDIVAFAELERFIDIPVKFYSSGMYVRLAFAIAINVDPDILLIDEVLAVGDQRFQDKCLRRVRGLRDCGVTILLVSHNLDVLQTLCDRAIWLDDGRVQKDGSPSDVVESYLRYARDQQAALPVEAQAYPDASETIVPTGPDTSPASEKAEVTAPADAMPSRPEPKRWGNGKAEVVEVQFLDESGRPTQELAVGEPATIVLHYKARQAIADPVFGIAVYRDDGLHLAGENTHLAHLKIPQIEGAGQVRYCIEALPLHEGEYYLSVAIHSADEQEAYDYQDLAHRFRVARKAGEKGDGIVYIPASWEHVAHRARETEGTSDDP